MKIRHLEVRNFRGIKSLCWHVKGDFNCIIGSGDACKTTILTALDYVLSPRTSLAFDDSDFFNQVVADDIVIQATLAEWDHAQPHVRSLFQERTFAQLQCGLAEGGPVEEPNGTTACSVSLRVDKSLEPKWFAVKGRDEGEGVARRPIYGSERALIGLSRLDFLSDTQFTWGRNTILTRLSEGTVAGLSGMVSELAREMRQSDISSHQAVAQCRNVAEGIRTEARSAGVNLSELTPRVDVQRQSIGVGVISLHEDQVPLRNKGSGSKRLIGAAMQMKLHNGKSISVIDEIELGLEPHRIRGLLLKLKGTQQQVFTTTHSAAVIRELEIDKNELSVCRRDSNGIVTVNSLNHVPDIQGPVRLNAEAFLGSRIVACEGPTEIGLLRAYDLFRIDEKNAPVWSLATAYFNCGGAPKIKPAAEGLAALGYQTAVLCDADAPEHLSDADVIALRAAGIYVAQWQPNNATEHQLFAEIPWSHMPALLSKIANVHETMTEATLIDTIIKEPRVASLALSTQPSTWPDDATLKRVIGDLAHEGSWIKRINRAQLVFTFALPLLPNEMVLRTQLALLWDWVQRND